ncbi:hypothetical protein [Rhizobium leguminosarum]|uniref:hypothetical protein n=1 Tax=Rhizobium leguminosarum TaxID=384 RepID=UPI001C94DF24|nr:hypothetical protein [Rhizobium leguminosarum]MBY5581870.1 hypothetical protein [Rhizobium leguminosarum]
MFIVIYRQHNMMHLDTEYHGPFTTWGDAYDFLGSLPALGFFEPEDAENSLSGVKFIQELKPAN